VFGVEDILVNNIAWLIRRFPLFPIFGDGQYRVQPIFVGDLAKEAVRLADLSGRQEADIIGPETYTFKSFSKLIAAKVAPGTRFIHLPPRVGWALGAPIGWLLNDVLLTWDELQGLMREKLTSPEAPRGETAFSQWLAANYDQLGAEYTSELARHFY
jgi:NADH dehydrogenase